MPATAGGATTDDRATGPPRLSHRGPTPSASARGRRRRPARPSGLGRPRQGTDHEQTAHAGRTARRSAARCRSRRWVRCRCTEPPTALDTTKPTRVGWARSVVTQCRTRRRVPARRPCRKATVKSSRWRRRCSAASTRAGDLRSGGDLRAALAAARGEDGAAGAGAHAQTETVHLGAATVVRLEGALAHGGTPGTRAGGPAGLSAPSTGADGSTMRSTVPCRVRSSTRPVKARRRQGHGAPAVRPQGPPLARPWWQEGSVPPQVRVGRPAGTGSSTPGRHAAATAPGRGVSSASAHSDGAACTALEREPSTLLRSRSTCRRPHPIEVPATGGSSHPRRPPQVWTGVWTSPVRRIRYDGRGLDADRRRGLPQRLGTCRRAAGRRGHHSPPAGVRAADRPLGLLDGTALLAVPNDLTKDVIEQKVREPLTRALSDAYGSAIRLAVTVDPLDRPGAGPRADRRALRRRRRPQRGARARRVRSGRRGRPARARPGRPARWRARGGSPLDDSDPDLLFTGYKSTAGRAPGGRSPATGPRPRSRTPG